MSEAQRTKYRTYVLSIGPVTLNVHRFDRRLTRTHRFKGGSWCCFFGIGSVAYWRGQRGFKMKVLPYV